MKLLRRTGWTLACVLTACFLQSFFQQPVALPLAVAIAAATMFSAWRPYPALLALAGLGPLSTILFSWGRGAAGTVQFAETLVLAFLTGWTAHRIFSGAPLKVPRSVRYPALLLALAATASGFVHWFGIRAGLPEQTVEELLRWYVFRDYLLRTPGIGPVAGAVGLACGMLLVLAAADACAESPERRRRVLLVMVCGATAAAAFNLRRVVQLSDGWPAFFEYLRDSRINVHYGDKNAAASYFALTLLLAAGLAARNLVLALVTTAVIACGLWLTGSRVALAATIVALPTFAGVGWRRAAPGSTRSIAALAVMAVLVGGAALYRWYPATRNFAASRAFAARADFARAGVRMAADAPVFGVGAGRYYDLSDRYASETLARLKFSRENAHNYFIQILAELGVPGLVGFIVLIGAALRQAAGAERPPPLHLTALMVGIGAYLLTCLGGHPLIVPEAAFPFWLAVGLAAAPFEPVGSAGWRWRTAAGLMAAVLIATVPWRATQAMRTADLEHVSTGFSMWQHAPDGMRYRLMGGRATFYVASTAKAVRIPFRIGLMIRRSVEVTVFLDGREASRLMVTADDLWRTLRVVIRGNREATFTRVDLVVAEPGAAPLGIVATLADGVVMVGRPEIEH
ncbi:MAG TPA: O-antigen ligase family protein [Vicinamibacterales bacterium]|nr:O-antigen ligase family protein [Vicinamibacterales bacterium]